MSKKVYQLETLSCPTCASKIGAMLKKTAGVETSEVHFMSSKVEVEFDEALITNEELKKRISKMGYDVLGEK